MGGRYEVDLGDDESPPPSSSYQPMEETKDDATFRLKSTVTKRKGRGFSSANDGLGSIQQFEALADDASSTAQKSVEGWVIFVSGIHEEANEDDVYDKFADFGPIRDLKMNLDHRTGYVKGYALIEYATFLEARSAIDNMNEKELFGLPIKCDFAFLRPPPATYHRKDY